jgi:hypothetical protein
LKALTWMLPGWTHVHRLRDPWFVIGIS